MRCWKRSPLGKPQRFHRCTRSLNAVCKCKMCTSALPMDGLRWFRCQWWSVDSPLHPHRHRRRCLTRDRLHRPPWMSIWRHHHRLRPLQRQLLVVRQLHQCLWSLGPSLPVVGSPLAPSMLHADVLSSLATAQMGWHHLPPPVGGPNGPLPGPWRLPLRRPVWGEGWGRRALLGRHSAGARCGSGNGEPRHMARPHAPARVAPVRRPNVGVVRPRTWRAGSRRAPLARAPPSGAAPVRRARRGSTRARARSRPRRARATRAGRGRGMAASEGARPRVRWRPSPSWRARRRSLAPWPAPRPGDGGLAHGAEALARRGPRRPHGRGTVPGRPDGPARALGAAQRRQRHHARPRALGAAQRRQRHHARPKAPGAARHQPWRARPQALGAGPPPSLGALEARTFGLPGGGWESPGGGDGYRGG
jgi:hypothetical protein